MPNDTETSLSQQLKTALSADHTFPSWSVIGLTAYLISAGVAAGIYYAQTHSPYDASHMMWTSAALACVTVLTPVFVRVAQRLRTRKPVPAKALAGDLDAVSPVIGVILMVAITVVLAAVVFVLVSKLASDTPSELPDFSMASDDHGASYYVLGADDGLAWPDLTVKGCTTQPTMGNVTAGDTVSGCAGHQVRVIYEPVNRVVWSS